MFKNRPIDSLNVNIVEILKISFIGIFFDNLMYESHPQNTDSNEIPFYYQMINISYKW